MKTIVLNNNKDFDDIYNNQKDLELLKKLKYLKKSSYGLSLISLGILLNYWQTNSNAVLNCALSSSSFIVANFNRIYGDYLEERILKRCKNKRV